MWEVLNSIPPGVVWSLGEFCFLCFLPVSDLVAAYIRAGEFLLVSDFVSAFTQGESLQVSDLVPAYTAAEELILVSDLVPANMA